MSNWIYFDFEQTYEKFLEIIKEFDEPPTVNQVREKFLDKGIITMNHHIAKCFWNYSDIGKIKVRNCRAILLK